MSRQLPFPSFRGTPETGKEWSRSQEFPGGPTLVKKIRKIEGGARLERGSRISLLEIQTDLEKK